MVSVLLLGACRRDHERTPADTLVVLIESQMKSADPRFALTSYDQKLSKLVASGLTAVDTPTLEPRLELAARIDRIDDLTWDVVLRADARFSDGTPVLASDVAWTYGSVLASASPSLAHRSFVERFASVTATATRTARFALVRPLATLQSDLDFGILSEHGAGPDGRTVVGAGPYKLDELTSLHATLEANPYAVGGAPLLPHVEIQFVRDAAARILMLVGGSADLVQNAVRLDLVAEVGKQPGVAVASAPSTLLTYMLLNNEDPVLQDLRVRQAIALAIDRPRLVAAKFSGEADLAVGLLPRDHWAFAADTPRWDYDPARARALLDAAGYPDRGDGTPRLALSYKTSSDAFRVAVAREIAANLALVGIDVDVRPFEFGTFFADIKKGQYQLATLQTSDLSEPDSYFSYFNSTRIPTTTNPDGNNRCRYANPDVDRLTVQGRSELDHGRRAAIYGEVQRLVARDVAMVPLFHEHNVVLTRTDVHGYRIVPNARLGGLVTTTKSR